MKLPFTIYLSTLIVMGSFSCGKPGEKELVIPPDIMSPHLFSKVVADFALAESSANTNIKNIPIHQFDSVYHFDPLKDNDVRPSQYDSALVYYSSHPELYKQVYDSVLVILSEYKARRINPN